MKVGILFGGPSREREISFAGGRTVYDNLDKTLFDAVPIFIDTYRNFILLDWQYIYKGSIRDFYPPVKYSSSSKYGFQRYVEGILDEFREQDEEEMIASIGKRIPLDELSEYIDFAFLALHGAYGEDGQIQGLLESLDIPYTGSGIRASSIGMDKVFQKKMMEAGGFNCPAILVLKRREWAKLSDFNSLYADAKSTIGFPMVIRPANQGSSIGVRIINEEEGIEGFIDAVNHAFFRKVPRVSDWRNKTTAERVQLIRQLTDLREGVGLPVCVKTAANSDSALRTEILDADTLYNFIETHFQRHDDSLLLEGHFIEQRVVLEAFIEGQEFSCIVIRNEDGKAIALPPTEIVKGGEVFDYRSKYLAGLSRKETPIRLPEPRIEDIRTACVRLFEFFEFNTYARIDGFIQQDGKIFLNDPNTTSGMLPSSFFFHQAAEIGLNPSQFLTYIIRTSLQERLDNILEDSYIEDWLADLDKRIRSLKSFLHRKRKIAVILGGYSSERHISVESGRNVYEKLASSDQYEPFPVFLTGNAEAWELYQLPINLLLKDNADDIRDKILHWKKHPVLERIREECSALTQKYGFEEVIFEPRALSFEMLAEQADGVFIALHGRPGEDGSLQRELERWNLPYNGSAPKSSAMTIDKYFTLQHLQKHGFTITDQQLVQKSAFESNRDELLTTLDAEISYPIIAKPVDDGCSSAVKMIKNRAQLEAFLAAMFRNTLALSEDHKKVLQLLPKEEFPRKNMVLIEKVIGAEQATRFMEITGGLLTDYDETGKLQYELFEPSEALSGGEVLSLEEKFLAGEGQNITPARFADNSADYKAIAAQVKTDLQRAAELLEVTGYARIDAFVRIFNDGRAETVIIEVNSLPGMTPATAIFHQCALNGYKPYEFIDKILRFGFERARRAELEMKR